MKNQQSEDVTVTLTSGGTTVESSIVPASSSSGGGGSGPGPASSTSLTKNDPLYTRYLIKTLSSNLNQIIYLLIPSLLTQYIIRVVYSVKASHSQHENSYSINSNNNEGELETHQRQELGLSSSPNPFHYPNDQQDLVAILGVINHAFAFLTLVYFILLVVSEKGRDGN